MTRRIFTLREARQLLPEVRRLTETAVEEVESLQQGMDAARRQRPDADDERRFRAIIQRWARAVGDLGAEAKGLWLVDFDSGDGLYWCWRHPESQIDWFHDYDGGFAGRRPLGDLGSE